jgi:hypothetical protein
MARQRLHIAVVFLLILGLSPGCTSKPQEEEPVIQRTGSGPLTAKQAYPIAKARAQKWRANAYLEEVIIVIPGNELQAGPRKITYSFVADRAFGPFRWWDSAFITVDTYEGEVSKVETLWGATHRQRLGRFDIDSAVLDSSDALQKAEALGGKAYREKYPNAHVRVIGTRGLLDHNEMFWRVGYFRPPEVRGSELDFGIEARTGEVRGQPGP